MSGKINIFQLHIIPMKLIIGRSRIIGFAHSFCPAMREEECGWEELSYLY